MILLTNGCTQPDSIESDGDKAIVRSFYHWRQDFQINSEQQSFLEKLEVEELYVHYFDVAWRGEEAVPIAEVSDISDVDMQINPVVYITTQVLEHSDSSQIEHLASRIADKIKTIHGENELKEIQIDCDWTPSIKDKYFYLLTELKNKFSSIELSATIRLYQYKYPELAGVPPVDKGLLMYYNMGEITSYREPNSILNNNEGKRYLGFNTYPLDIDIALPNFSWVLLFQTGNFQKICAELNEEDLADKSLFKSIGTNLYACKKDTVIGNTYFRFGDELRLEKCNEDQLIEAANLLRDEINQDQTRIIIYDLQTDTPKDYEKLDAVYTVFEQ